VPRLTVFTKFIGVTPELSALIERRRLGPDQSECEILVLALSESQGASAATVTKPTLDLGQGVRIDVGERLYLFLQKPEPNAQPDGVAEAAIDGLYVEGRRIAKSRGSLLHPAMRHFQEQRGHRNTQGDVISLSAYRQWHVRRQGELIPLSRLKDPALARHRRSWRNADLLDF
jgi:hypothetical protein